MTIAISKIKNLGGTGSKPLENNYRIRLFSTRLKSGRCQVKFYANVKAKQVYGYVLVNAEETLKSVVQKIKSRLDLMVLTDIHHIHLFSIKEHTLNPPGQSGGVGSYQDLNFILFDS